MKVRRGRKPAPRHVERGGMWALVEQYLDYMRVHNYSAETVRCRSVNVRRFVAWCEERSLTEPTDVTQPIIERYQRWLYYHRKTDGRPLNVGTQNHMLVCVKAFFRWTTRQHLTLFNPASEIELARKPHRLPRDILTAAEAEAVMSQPDVREPLGIRDRAILETFYATGMRRIELVNVALYDLDANRGTVMVREGKGLKDRVVPIGQRALDWIDKYLIEVRPGLAVEPDEKYLFLTSAGGPFHGRWVMGELVRRYILAAGIGKSGGCHMFRHTVATLMLENGADIRFIQELLGHTKLTSTQIYTHVSIAKLQQIYRATHPLERARDPSGEPATPLAPEARELLDTLDQDDDQGSELAAPPGEREAG